MAAFNLTLEWWQVVLGAVVWWVSLMAAYRYGYVSRRHSDKNRSRNRSHSRPALFDDESFHDLAAPTPDLLPPVPAPEPELSPWVAYDDGSWQRLCSAGCHQGILYNPVRHCGRCDGSGYEVTYIDPHPKMLPSPYTAPSLYDSLATPLPTSDEAGQPGQQAPSRAEVTLQWPPRELIEHDPVRPLDP